MTGIIIQARIASTRLPLKVCLNIRGKSIIEHVIERCLQTGYPCVLAVPGEERHFWHNYMPPFSYLFYGDSQDVLARYYRCAQLYEFSKIVRITGDCPCIDPLLIQETVAVSEKYHADYTSTRLQPPAFPDGLDVEVMTFQSLQSAYINSIKPYDREHVTPHIISDQKNRVAFLTYNGPEDFKCSIDTVEDFEFLTENWGRITSIRWTDYIGGRSYGDNL